MFVSKFLLAACTSMVPMLFSGCSDNIEVIDQTESLSVVSELRLYKLVGEATGNVVLKSETLDDKVSFKLAFKGFSQPTCADSSAFLYNAEDASKSEVKVSLTQSEGDFEEDIAGSVNAEDYPNVRIMCGSEIVGAGASGNAVPTTEAFVKGGSFSAVGSHSVTGQMKIYRNTVFSSSGAPMNTYTLRFENILADEGPDLLLYFTASPAPVNADEPGSLIVELDERPKGSFSKQGDFNQNLPEDFDPSAYNGAMVWCRQVGVMFGILGFTDFP